MISSLISRPSRAFPRSPRRDNRARLAARRRSVFMLERVEDRTLLSNWIGAVDNDWFNPGNWDAGVPSATNPATIQGNVTVNIDVPGAVAKSVKLTDGATLTGDSLSVRGNFTVDTNSDFNIGAVTFNGNGSRSVETNGSSFTDVVISIPDNGELTFKGATNIDGDLTFSKLSRLKAGALNLEGNLTSNVASFSGSGTVVFVGAENQTINAGGETGLVPGLAFNKPDGSVTIGADPLRVLGGWKVDADNNASINSDEVEIQFVGQGSRTIDAGDLHFKDVRFGITDQGILTVVGDLPIDGNLSIVKSFKGVQGGNITVGGNIHTESGTSSMGSGVFTLVGNKPQTITSGDNGGSLLGLKFEKTGGSVTIASGSNLRLSSGLLVNQASNIPFSASGSTIEFRGTSARTINTGYATLGDVVFNINGQAGITVADNLKIGGDLTIRSANTINAPLDAITVAGNLTSTASRVGGAANIWMVGNRDASIKGGDFPNGGIIIDKGGGTTTLHADVTTPLAGVLDIRTLQNFSGSLAVAGNVISRANNVYAQNGGQIVFTGGGKQTLTTTTKSARVPGVVIDKQGGSLTLNPANPINVTGDWTYERGDVITDGSRVLFATGSTTVDIAAGPLGPGMRFNDVEVAISGNLHAKNMVVAGGLQLRVAATIEGQITALGNVVATASAAMRPMNGGEILFTGDGRQTLTGKNKGLLPGVRIDKSGGDLTIIGDIGVTGPWQYTKGTVDAGESTVTFSYLANRVDTGSKPKMAFNNVVIDLGGSLTTANLAVGGDLTIARATAINADPGKITVGGNLTSKVATRVNGNADITLVDGGNVAITGGVFPGGGIIINKSSASVVTANVTQALGGPLWLKKLSALRGTFHVGGNVQTSDTTVDGNADGAPVLVFTGTGNQTLKATTAYAQVPGVKINKAGGRLTIGDTPIGVTGDWEHVDGNVVLDGTTIRFAGKHQTVDAGSTVFNNVDLNNSTSKSVMTIDSMIVGGELTLSKLDSFTGVIEAKGDVTTKDTDVGGPGTILFNGEGDQTLTGIGYGQVPNVTIDKDGGALTLADQIGVTGDWSYVRGGFDAADSTVRFAGKHQTVDASSTVFNNVDLNNSTSKSVMTIDSMIVGGELTLSYLDSFTGVIDARGDVTTKDTTVGGPGTILFNGEGDQTLTGIGYGQVPNVEINKDGGVLTLDGKIGVSGDWNYVGGGFDAGESTVRFAGLHQRVNSGSTVFNHVDLNNSSSKSIMEIVDSMIVGGELTLSKLDSFTGVIEAKGDVTTKDTTVGGPGVILFNGSGNQTLSAGINLGQLPNVKIQKGLFSSLTIGGSNTISVSGDWEYSGLGLNVWATDSKIRFAGLHQRIDSGLMVFGDVDFNNSSSTSIMTIDGSMNVGGEFVLSKLASFDGTVRALGDVTTKDDSVGGSGTILFAGLGDQTFKAGVTNGQVPNVRIQKLGGKLTIGEKVGGGPSRPIEVTGDWTYYGFGRNVDAVTNQSKIRFVGGDKTVRPGLMVFYDVDFAVGRNNKVEIIAPIGNSAGNLYYAGEINGEDKVTKKRNFVKIV